jgi:integrase
MGFKEYKVGEPYEEFEKSLSSMSESSAKMYRQYFAKFLEWGGYTPEQFYEWVKSLESAEDSRSRRQLTLAYNDFAKKCVDEGASPNTVLNYRKAIHKFLEANELTLRIRKNGGKTRYRGQKIIRLDQARKLIDLAATNLRLRALLMTLKDTGLGVSEVAMLTCEDFHGAREYKDEEGGRFKAWAQPLIREKTGEGCYVHMGPDAVAAIEDYIGQRRTGPIFITSKGQPHKDEGGNITSEAGFTEKGSPMKALAITTSLRHHCRLLRTQGYKVSAHSFRKLFETSFDLEGDLNVAKKVMGKAIPASDEPYLQYEDELTKVYMEVYRKRLSLDRESTRINDLEEEIEELKAGKSGEVEELHAKLVNMEAQQRKYDEAIGLIMERLKESQQPTSN